MARLCTCNCTHETTCQVNLRRCSLCMGSGGEGARADQSYQWNKCKNCNGEGWVPKTQADKVPISRGPLSVA